MELVCSKIRTGNKDCTTRLQAGLLGFDSRKGQGIVLVTTASRPALRTTQPPIQWLPGAICPWVRRPGREANHHNLESRLKIRGAMPPLPLHIHGVVLCEVQLRLHSVIIS